MEDLPNNCFEVKIPLYESECLRSKKLEKICSLKFTKEDDNIFTIDAVVDDKEFLARFTMFDLLNMKEKNFTHKIHNFKLLLKAIKKGVKKKKVTVSQFNTSLKFTLFYTIVYDKEKISFELNPKPSEENKKEEKEKVNEIKNENYKAELIEYSRDMEDLGDRNIIKVVFENKGICSWPKGKTSFTCLPEFSSLLCQECILEDDVMPGEQIEIYLEFLKNEKQSLKKKYFTALNLNVYQERFENIFLLDFNNPLNQENVDENADDNEKEEESEEKSESSEDNEENKVNKEEVKMEEKKVKEKEKEKEMKDEKVTIKEDVNEKGKKDVKEEKNDDSIKKRNEEEDLKDDENGKKQNVKKIVNEINQKEKERKEKEEEQKKEKGWRKLFHFHRKKK